MHGSFSSPQAKTVIVAFFLAAVIGSSPSGSPFLNLGFDDGDTNKVAFGDVGYAWGKTEDYLPGWQLVSGTKTVQFVGIGDVLPAFGDAMLFNGEGKFLLDLKPEGDGSTHMSLPYSLSQTGEIPQDAKTIHFLSYGPNFPPFAHFSLSLDGTDIPLAYVPKSGSPGWIEANDVYGDVSAFAGQTVNLTLATIPTDRAFDYAIDSISFSSMIPEPTPLLLLLLGSGLVIWWAWQGNLVNGLASLIAFRQIGPLQRPKRPSGGLARERCRSSCRAYGPQN